MGRCVQGRVQAEMFRPGYLSSSSRDPSVSSARWGCKETGKVPDLWSEGPSSGEGLHLRAAGGLDIRGLREGERAQRWREWTEVPKGDGLLASAVSRQIDQTPGTFV